MERFNKQLRSILLAFIHVYLFSYSGWVHAQGMGVGTTTPASTLDVSGNLTVGATYSGTNAAPANGVLIQGNVGIGTTAPNGKLHVQEATGTTTSASAGTLILEHGNIGGMSGILFKSNVNAGGDYGYIKYLDDGSGNGSQNENGLLEFGVMDDVPGNAYEDDIAIMPSGNVGINTRAPNSDLHVSGAYQGNARSVSTSVTLADDDWNVLVTNNSTTTITLPTLVSGTSDGKILHIRITGGASTSITIAAAVGNTLSGSYSFSNPLGQKQGIVLISMGTVWYVVAGG
jgi:hypothetical protein